MKMVPAPRYGTPARTSAARLAASEPGKLVVRYQAVAVVAKRDPAIGVKEVGLVIIDEVLDAVEPLELPGVGDLAAHSLSGNRLVLGEWVVEIGVGGVGAVVGNARIAGRTYRRVRTERAN